MKAYDELYMYFNEWPFKYLPLLYFFYKYNIFTSILQ